MPTYVMCSRLMREILPQTRRLLSSTCTRKSNWEPEYLAALKPSNPQYDLVNVQLKGYDFRVLESYQKYVEKLAENFGVSVNDSWATPASKYRVDVVSDANKVVDQLNLTKYERNVQFENLPACRAGLMLSLLKRTLPPGVELSVHEHLPEHEQIRMVPDFELLELKSQLQDIQKPK